MSSSSQQRGGPKPAHQNKYAFRHNPRSKKTQQILQSPIEHVCRRCFQKLEWRKQYRKYKPLQKQPRKCNLCQMKNIHAAYHTICSKCSLSSTKAQEVLQEYYANNQSSSDNNNNINNNNNEQSEQPNEDDTGGAAEAPRLSRTRVCEMCVKEPALFCHDDNEARNNSATEGLSSGPKLQLRQLRTLQRQALRKKRTQDPEDEDESNKDAPLRSQDDSFDDGDEEDPFLQAVGGLALTGPAYQEQQLLLLSSSSSTKVNQHVGQENCTTDGDSDGN